MGGRPRLIGLWLGRRARDLIADRVAARQCPDAGLAARGRPRADRAQPALAAAASPRSPPARSACPRPQVPAIATGFAIIWALAWRRQASAVTAIEERDGARFYVERTSPLRPIKLVRTPGFRSNLLELNGASARGPRGRGRDSVCACPRCLLAPARRAGRLGRRHHGLARRRARAGRRPGARRRARRTTRGHRPGPRVRTFMLTDFVAGAVRPAGPVPGRAPAGRAAPIVYCSITAALLWPRPGAIWLDVLTPPRTAPGVMASGSGSGRATSPGCRAPAADDGRATRWPRWARRLAADGVVVPVAVEPPGPGAGVRDIDVLAYAGDPHKRRLDFILAAWAAGAPRGRDARRRRDRRRGAGAAGSALRRPAGARRVPGAVRRARVYVAAPTSRGLRHRAARGSGGRLHARHHAGPGALSGARPRAAALDPRLVGEDLAPALRAALDDPRAGLRRARGRADGAVQPRGRRREPSPSAFFRDCCQHGHRR